MSAAGAAAGLPGRLEAAEAADAGGAAECCCGGAAGDCCGAGRGARCGLALLCITSHQASPYISFPLPPVAPLRAHRLVEHSGCWRQSRIRSSRETVSSNLNT